MTRPALLRAGLAATIAIAPLPAAAALHALGHEFRPTLEERTAPNPCTDADGVTAVFDYRCPHGEAEDGSCIGSPYPQHRVVEWRSSTGELVAGPYTIAEDSGYHPYGCAADGAVIVMVNRQVLVVDHDGPRGSTISICQSEPCDVREVTFAANAEGFLAVWSQLGSEIRGRFFAKNGSPLSDEFAVGDPLSGGYALTSISGDDGDVVVAWATSGWPSYDVSVRATVVHGDGGTEADIVLNEFIHGPFEGTTIVPAASGLFVVAWQNYESQAGWVARRIAVADNLPTTTSTTTTTTLDETSPLFLPAETFAPTIGAPVFRPGLAADGAGHWIATWTDLVNIAWPNRIVFSNFFASSGDDARRWSATSPVQDDGSTASVPPTVAMDAGAVAVMTWADLDGHHILYRRSADGGQSWSAPAPLHTITEWTEWEHDQTVSGLTIAAGGDGRWIAAWMEQIWAEIFHEDYYVLEVVSCAVRTSVSTDGGQTWQQPQTVDEAPCNEYEGNGDRGVDIANDGAGNWLTVWITDDVRSSRSDDDGSTWSLPVTLYENSTETPRSVAVGAGSDGSWLLALEASHPTDWPSSPSDSRPRQSRIYLSRSEDLGGDWSSFVGLEPWHDEVGGSDAAPSVAAGENGQWGIAWESFEDIGGSGLDSDILIAFSDDDGASWGSPRIVDPEAVGDTRTDLVPQLTYAGLTWGLMWRTIEQPDLYYTPFRSSVRFARTTGACGNGDIDAGEQCDDGNLTSGDGCDVTCAPTGCGSGIVSGDEECDDGNGVDTDGCLPTCRLPYCGDGATWRGVEECDDGNTIDTDDCLSECTLARCGDSEVREGVEECDEGSDQSSNDACLPGCIAAQCGDGSVHSGVEECDDGNTTDGDRCTEQCRLDPVCGPAPRRTVSDALAVLKKAVGLSVYCPMLRCDTNRDGAVTTSDALQTLRFAVGLDLVDPCGVTHTLVIRLQSNEKPAALQFVLSYLDSPGDILFSGTAASCTTVVPDSLSSTRLDAGRGFLVAGIIHLTGFQGPLDLMRCEFRTAGEAAAGDFQITVQEATARFGIPIDPLPTLIATIE